MRPLSCDKSLQHVCPRWDPKQPGVDIAGFGTTPENDDSVVEGGDKGPGCEGEDEECGDTASGPGQMTGCRCHGHARANLPAPISRSEVAGLEGREGGSQGNRRRTV
ncbi:unnamed protein product, partial [Ectocarpus sp. 12 AP-2014]